MNRYQLLLPAFTVTLLASCQLPTNNQYDTDPYGLPDASYDGDFGDAVYDTPPAYEDDADAPDLTPDEPAQVRRHKVVRGDTLSGISRKYNVSMSAIKSANNMRSDVVVLGRTLIIPAR